MEVKDENLSGVGEIAIFNPDDSVRIDVRVNGDTVWLTCAQMAILYDRDIKTIAKHISEWWKS